MCLMHILPLYGREIKSNYEGQGLKLSKYFMSKGPNWLKNCFATKGRRSLRRLSSVDTRLGKYLFQAHVTDSPLYANVSAAHSGLP
jgi:hypothetical protein